MQAFFLLKTDNGLLLSVLFGKQAAVSGFVIDVSALVGAGVSTIVSTLRDLRSIMHGTCVEHKQGKAGVRRHIPIRGA
jgi:hypothetical protein